MKRSKIVFLVIIFLIVFLLLTVSNVSQAAIANISLKITQERNAEIGWTTDQNTNKGSYKIKYQLYTDDTEAGSKTKNVWKLEEASNSSGEKLDNLYCIRAGLGFASETGHAEGTVKTYNQVYDLTKDYENVQSILNSSSVTLFKTDSKANYNAVMWILDHMILEDAEDTEVEKYLWDNVYKNLDDYDYEEEEIKLVTSGMRFDILSKADIEAIQQLAIWHFSNRDEDVYKEDELSSLFINITDYTMNGVAGDFLETSDKKGYESRNGWANLTDWGNNLGIHDGQHGTKRQAAAAQLYKYLITTAENETKNLDGLYQPNREVKVYLGENPTTEQPVVTVLEQEKVKIKVNKNWDDFDDLEGLRNEYEFTLKGKVNNKEISLGINDATVKLTKDQKTYEWSNLPKTHNGVEIVYSIEETKVPDKYTVEISKDSKGDLEYNYIFNVTNKHRWADISLRKFVSAVNGAKPSVSREPKVDTSEFNTKVNGVLQTTAKYIHPKNPLTVEADNIITYTIRIYNEGSEPAYVKEIMDHLPANLEFLADENGNEWIVENYDKNSGGTTVKSTENCKIVNAGGKLTESEKGKTLGSVQIPEAEKIADQGTDRYRLSYVDVEIKCKVKAEAPSKTNLTNIAEVTNMKASDGTTDLVDRDSTQKNANIPNENEKPSYRDEQSKQQYVPGQEDDDDFEKVKIDKIKVKVNKNWDDFENLEGIRDQYEFTLKGKAGENNVTIENATVTLTKDEKEHVWTDLPKTKDGVEIIYSVEETSVPEGYTYTVERKYDEEGNAEYDYIFNVTNTHRWADISLRKFITEVNDVKQEPSREPEVDTSLFNTWQTGTDGTEKLQTTAIYNHTKEPVNVTIGDIVKYTIRIYNEGTVDSYVSEIKDHLPANMEFLAEENAGSWEIVEEERNAEAETVKASENCTVVNYGGSFTENVKGKKLSEVLIPSAKKNEEVEEGAKDSWILSYVDVEIVCKVKETAPSRTPLTNIAEVTEMTDAEGKALEDRDSKQNNANIPEESNKPTYKDEESSKEYVPGQEDDDDFEKVVVTKFDLALRKFISKVDGKELEVSREPKPDTTKLKNGTGTTAEYPHSKEPIKVKAGSLITYTMRIYNEGDIDGKVKEITDYLDKSLIYEPTEEEVANGNNWTMTEGEENNKVESTVRCKVVKVGGNTSKEYEGKYLKDVIIPHYDVEEDVLSYIDVEINCRIVEQAGTGIKLTNIAEITESTDDKDNPQKDIDSTPDNGEIPNKEELPGYNEDKEKDPYVPGQEDDDDFEKVVVEGPFDLALRKFITKVENTDVNNRYPQVKYEDGKLSYEHTKEPIELVTGDTVIYTIRVYNEGEKDGYAEEVTDDVPEGLEYLPDNEINKEYRWVLLDENEEETDDVSKAKYIVTDYLSQEQGEEAERDNLLKAFDKNAEISDGEVRNPDYRDLKIAFKVTFKATTKDDTTRILKNVAQISKDSDDDEDSEPNRDTVYDPEGPNEDDIDYENVKVKYFDLSLLKWVSEAKVTVNGKTETVKGNSAENSKNEPPIKIEIEEKNINKVVIKYKYIIRVTNEGEIEGYADEVTDYIPEGLRFEAGDNTEWRWTQKENGTLTTDYLKDTLLKPGEYAEIPLILTWNNSKDNIGEKINTAEISKDRNDSNSPDVDSTPNNKIPKEDDIDDAPVILAVKTGKAVLYIGLVFTTLVILGVGVAGIKKYVAE